MYRIGIADDEKKERDILAEYFRRFRKETAEEIGVFTYDSGDATVLMEKGLYCREHGIQWSCMADGSRLDFMRSGDVYSIFGNALDNAIEAVEELKEKEKKIISVCIIVQKELLVIQIQNYYDRKLEFKDGLPVTTRKNRKNHGYGMKSIRYTAEKYNGTVTCRRKTRFSCCRF